MKLTEKCKEEFLKHCKQSESFMDTYADVYLNALIIEFFDSVGIYVLPIFQKHLGWYCDIRNDKSWLLSQTDYFKSRTEATNVAIEKANSIYNEKI